MSIRQANFQFFKQNGYLPLGKILTETELNQWIKAFDRDHTQFTTHWGNVGPYQTANGDILLTSPDFDQVIRHPKVISLIQDLMGGPVCFSEISLRHMGGYNGPLHRNWHRDRGHWLSHPLRIDYIQLMIYLTDVDQTTHCFSISPESTEEPVLEPASQLQKGGLIDFYGPAGTGVLFNVAVLHTATVRSTNTERKSVQIYYGHIDRPHLSEVTYIPHVFWRDHPEPEVRAFYSILNRKTEIYWRKFSDQPHLSLGQKLEELLQINRQIKGE